jgi:anti-sigma factor ChrR (cupin superfamily)
MKAKPDKPPTQSLEAGIRQSLDQALNAERAGDGELLARVKTRVMGAIEQKSGQLHRTVRAEAGTWEPVAPGVERKLLWERGDATSCLIRLAPGASFPPHGHPIDEESVILEGSLRIGADLLLRVGDFHVGLSGVKHETVSTDEGCLCFLRTARCFFEPAG